MADFGLIILEARLALAPESERYNLKWYYNGTYLLLQVPVRLRHFIRVVIVMTVTLYHTHWLAHTIADVDLKSDERCRTASASAGCRARVAVPVVAAIGAALVATSNAASAAEPIFPTGSPQVDGDVIHKRVVPALHPTAHRDLSVSGDAHWLGEAAPEEHAR